MKQHKHPQMMQQNGVIKFSKALSNSKEYYCKICFYREWRIKKGVLQITGVVLK